MFKRIMRILGLCAFSALFIAYLYGDFAAKRETVLAAAPENYIIYVTPAPDGEVPPAPTPGIDVTPAVTPEPTLDPNSPAGRAAALGLAAPPEIDIDSWEYILANGDHSIDRYAPPEIVVLEDQSFDSRIIEPLKEMSAAARAAGLKVYLSSGYRDYDTQAANFIRVCENNGVSDGKTSAGFYITMPAGCSEHQTGLACDITDQYYPLKNASLENTELFQWLKVHCHEFGFIVRFPKDKEVETGVMYEPFHFRYVGVEAAAYIMENGLCFEEFVNLYR